MHLFELNAFVRLLLAILNGFVFRVIRVASMCHDAYFLGY